MSLAAILAAAAATAVTVFTPWSSSGLRNGLTVSHRVNGTCWTGSLATDRPDAWRCHGRGIEDPCFRSLSGTEVACPQRPDVVARVDVIELAKPLAVLGKSMPVEQLSPWSLRLHSGTTCTYATGPTYTIARMRANYACDDGGWVLDVPSRVHPVWQAKFVKSSQETAYSLVDVDEAIF